LPLHPQFLWHLPLALGHPTNKGKIMSIFDEKYRVVGIEENRLMVRGIQTGDLLTIINPQPELPLSEKEYPVGKLIALSDPSISLHN
jgi:hypothetical protein